LAPPRTHAVFAKSLHSTGGSISAGIGYANNRDRDDSVEDGWETLDAGGFDSNDKWRVSRVSTRRQVQIWVVRWDDETEDKQRNNVEESNAPEDLFGGLGNSLAGVIALSRSETNELSTSEGKGGYNENGTKARKAVLKRAGVAPVFTTNVAPMSSVSDQNFVDSKKEAYLLSVGTPPQLIIMPKRMNPTIAVTLTMPNANSTSP
jgi:hypothetical protein